MPSYSLFSGKPGIRTAFAFWHHHDSTDTARGTLLNIVIYESASLGRNRLTKDLTTQLIAIPNSYRYQVDMNSNKPCKAPNPGSSIQSQDCAYDRRGRVLLLFRSHWPHEETHLLQNSCNEGWQVAACLRPAAHFVAHDSPPLSQTIVSAWP